jgi:rhodanese-related sulfurtransferase
MVRKVLLGDTPVDPASVIIVDCRYTYEFEGGHITGALNLPRAERQVLSHFYRSDHTPAYPSSTTIIFHCEFSSKRGPAAIKALRAAETGRYAAGQLERDYPEVYLLNGGYKAFYEWERSSDVPDDESLCTPVGYVLMRDKAFFDEMSAAVRQERADSRELKRSQSLAGSRGRRHASLSLSMSDLSSGLHPGVPIDLGSPSPTGRRGANGGSRSRRGSTGRRNIFGEDDDVFVDPNAIATTPVRARDDTGLMSPAPRPARLSFGLASADMMDDEVAHVDNEENVAQERSGRRTMPPPSSLLTRTSYW